MQSETIHLVSGKGGVGKTTVACALALAEARRGRKTLLVEINGGDRVAQALGVEPVGYAMREVFNNLWVADLTPQESLREYVLLIIRIEALYRAVFESRMVRSFLRLLPALGELTMLGKIWYEAVQQEHGKPRFDCIVVDAPATGHARALFSASAQIAQSIPAGPMRENADRIDALLRDQKRTRMHVVTTPEQMPVEEANELWSFSQKRGIPRGLLVINQALPSLPDDALTAMDLWQNLPPFDGVLRAMQAREQRVRSGLLVQKELVAPLAHQAALSAHAGEKLDVATLEAMGNTLLAALQNLRSKP